MKKKILGILAVISAVVVFVMAVFPVASANLSLKANNVTTSSDDGQIKSVTVSPEGTFSWEGVDVDVDFDGDDRIAYNIYVKLNDGDWGLLYSANQDDYNNIEDMGTTGYDKFAFKNIEVKKPNVIAYWQLAANEDGTENVNQIHVKIEATLQTSDVIGGSTQWKDLVSASSTATFSFTCINEKAVADVGGSINPDAEQTRDT